MTVMNSTLESIQDNTSVGAQALSSAAADLKQAGEAFRQQMDEAARDGGNVARASIEATGARIARLTDELTSKAGQQLMSPLGEIWLSGPPSLRCLRGLHCRHRGLPHPSADGMPLPPA